MDFLQPSSWDEALAVRAERPDALPIAGGTDGHVRNPSFTDHLLPTVLDMPPMRVQVLEYADPHAPYGVRGVGEPPTTSSRPAVAAAVRAACGRPLRRVPIRPEHVTGIWPTLAPAAIMVGCLPPPACRPATRR